MGFVHFLFFIALVLLVAQNAKGETYPV